MTKRKESPKPNLVREYVNLLAGFLDGYYMLPGLPSESINTRLQTTLRDLHKSISSELRRFRRVFDTWESVAPALPEGEQDFDEARLLWRGEELPLRKFMDQYAKYAMTLDDLPLTEEDVVAHKALRERVDQVLNEAESLALKELHGAAPATPAVADADQGNELQRLARCFDRPALYTPFYQEASLPDFRKAVTDTIEALNTGIRRLRDGTVIERVMSRHDFADRTVRDRLGRIERLVVDIRTAFDGFIRDGQIELRAVPGSQVRSYRATRAACQQLDMRRATVLDAVRRLIPTFAVTLAADASTDAYPCQTDDDGRVKIGAELTHVPSEPVEWSEPMTISELALRFKVNRKTMSNWIKKKDGNGIRFKRVGRLYCVAMADLPN